MKKHILKNERGITLTVLIITIIVLAILTGVAVKNINTGTDIKQYNYMCADIELLESKIMVYYNNMKKLPITGDAFNAKSTLGTQASSKDNDNYYRINLQKLTNITLNYGGGNLDNKDVYIINEQSHNVYYLRGVQLENTTYYVAKIKVTDSITDSTTDPTTDPTTNPDTGTIATGTEEYVDTNEDKAMIPGGFTVSGLYSESTIEGGLVIYLIPEGVTVDWEGTNENAEDDDESDENTGIKTVAYAQKHYDQFVWIPIAKENINDMYMCQSETGTKSCKITVQEVDGKEVAYCTTHNSTQMAGRLYATATDFTFYSNLTTQTYTADSGLREPAILTGTDGASYDNNTTNLGYLNGILKTSFTNYTTFKTYLQEEYNETVKSVYENEGFYVGRYETNNITTADGTAIKVVAGETPSNCKNWYYMYAQQKDYATNKGLTNVIGSTMIQGAAYDQVIKFVYEENKYDVTTAGNVGHSNFTTTPYQTGGRDYSTNYSGTVTYNDISRNIYDLEGNVRAWTTEAGSTNNRIYRGGCYDTSNSVSYRIGNYPELTNASRLGTLIQLYVK